jgi:hypothetical protein
LLLGTTADPNALFRMKSVIATLIAVAILWALDNALNDGRYTEVVRQAISSLVGVRV